MYYIDTPTYRVMAYEYDNETGNLQNGRVAVEVPQDFGSPDGMTIDIDGMLWIAHWDGWQITRWDPSNGKLLLRVPVPTARVTSCTFGGTDLTDIYITSASVGLTDEQLAKQPLAGALFVITASGYRGHTPDTYRG